MKIKKGDTVKIIKGNERGKTGDVLSVLREQNKIVVKGVHVAKRHLKASKTTPHGGIVDKTLPVSISNVQLVCPNCAKPTRIGYEIKDNHKVRLCKKCKKSMK